jgi:hypothetical protein
VSSEFVKVWQLLALAYPSYGRELEAATLAETLRLYERLLSDLPVEVLKTATLRHIATSKWFPTAAELRSAALEIVAPSSQEQTALEAWGDVMDTFASGVCYAGEFLQRTPRFRNPLTQAAVAALGGWLNLCRSENAVADRARFVEVYGQLRGRQRTERQLPPMLRSGAALPELAAGELRGGWEVGREDAAPAGLLTARGLRNVGELAAQVVGR